MTMKSGTCKYCRYNGRIGNDGYCSVKCMLDGSEYERVTRKSSEDDWYQDDFEL